MPVSLKDQVALVVGASSGIGRATAVLVAAEGMHVMAAARREDRLRELEAELKASGGSIAIKSVDASSPEDMVSLAKDTIARFGKIDILVYASGTNTPDRSMKRLNPEIW